MSAKEYLESKTKFEDKYPNIPEFMQQNEIIKEKKSYKYRRQLPSPKFNKEIYIPFSDLQKTTKKISEGTESILNSMKTIGALVTLAGVSFIGINKILDGMGKLAEGQTAVDLLKPSTYGSSGRSTGKLGSKGAELIHGKEGCYLYAYDDAAPKKNGKPVPFMPGDKLKGTLTIGWGHTGKDVKPGMTITQAQADALFEQDIASKVKAVNRLVKVPISQNQFDALVSFTYNAGEGSLARSEILKKLNAGDYRGAAEAWKTQNIKQGTIFEKGLRDRRAKESALFASDISEDNKLKGTAINEQIKQPMKTGGSIADNYGGAFKTKKAGNYDVKNEVIMSGQMNQFLKEVSSDYGGSGKITSVMDGNMHKGNSGYNKQTHKSGNKADIGLGAYDNGSSTNIEAIANQCIPIMRHPAIVHVAIEGLGKNHNDSIRLSKIIEKRIREKAPDIDQKLKRKEFQIKHWGWTYTKKHAPHLDICINPDKLKNTPKQAFTQGSSNTVKMDNNNDKLKQNENKQNKSKNQVRKDNKGNISVNNQSKQPTINKTKDIGSVDYYKVRGDRNGNTKKE